MNKTAGLIIGIIVVLVIAAATWASMSPKEPNLPGNAIGSPTPTEQTTAQGAEPTQTASYTVLDQDPLITTYGQYPWDVFQKAPEILTAVKSLDPKFIDEDMNVSSGTKVIAFSDGRKMLFLEGCVPHACYVTDKAAVYDLSSKTAYMAARNIQGAEKPYPSQEEVVYFGNPDPLVTQFLSEYFQP